MPIKAVFFDFMGTCLDWHSRVLQEIPPNVPQKTASQFILDWRHSYFAENSMRIKRGLPVEDIDMTLARVLEQVLSKDTFAECKPHFDVTVKEKAVKAWHSQKAWTDMAPALQDLRDKLGLEVFVHANGTTRLQLDLCRSSGLRFDMLLSSELLGYYMPQPEAYEKALKLLKLQPEEIVKVAAHAYDVRGAKKCGMKTIYIHRWTDDIDEDMELVKGEFDAFLEGMKDLPDTVRGLM